jgi:hypothetical protein
MNRLQEPSGATMERVYFTTHNGKQVLVQDLTDSKDITENIAVFDRAEQLILTQPSKSVRLLTNVTNAHYSTEGVDRMKRFSKNVTPHMLASATVGIDGLKRMIVKAINKLTGRDVRVFDTVRQALDWLAAQE